jgi:hypothetical protein
MYVAVIAVELWHLKIANPICKDRKKAEKKKRNGRKCRTKQNLAIQPDSTTI